MAITSYKYENSTLTRETELGSTTTSRQKHVQTITKSGKVSGSFITFPDGSRFRRPTNYYIRTFGIQGGAPNIQNGRNVNMSTGVSVPRNIRSLSGGYWSDDLMASGCPSYSGPVTNRLYDSPNLAAGMVNEAVTKALNNIADQKANIGEGLATLRQTINLVKNPASTLLGSLKSAWNDRSLRPYLKRSVKDLRRNGIPESIAQKYLEYVYGWIPLMSDIHGIIQLMKQQGQRPMLISGKGTANQKGGSPGGSYWNPSQKHTTSWTAAEETAKVSCQIYGRIDPNAAGLRTLNQLGLLNPLSLIYELTPWSFVVDWFVPIGPVLNALTAPAGLIFVSGTKSVKSSFTGQFEHWKDPYGLTVDSDIHATGTATAERYVREVYGTWPRPGFFFSSNPFAGDRPLKALALGIVNLRTLRI